jgi:phosphomannomutase
MASIKFGTDGWRAKMADDFTVENVQRVAQASARYFKEMFPENLKIAIGYDGRKNSALFAKITAEVFSEFGFTVLLSEIPIPTPVLSFTVITYKTCGGIMITASHNPAEYNGFKIKSYQGCSAPAEVTSQIEKMMDGNEGGDTYPRLHSHFQGTIERINMQSAYFSRLEELINFEIIKKQPPQIVIDPIFGVGAGWLSGILKKHEIPHKEIHGKLDPTFGGYHPEPLAENVPELMDTVRKLDAGFAVGLSMDGDADRNGAVGTLGNFLNSQKVYCLLLHHLSQNKSLAGCVVHAFNNSRLIGKLAKKYGHAVSETKIGFKYIADFLLKEAVVLGGEESGGYANSEHIPDRDGIYNNLLLLELMASEKRSLDEIYLGFEKEFGRHEYLRRDLHLSEAQKQKLMQELNDAPPQTIAGLKVLSIERLDGVKLNLQDNAWVLLRVSGTEPLLRVYAEAESESLVAKILDGAESLTGPPAP